MKRDTKRKIYGINQMGGKRYTGSTPRSIYSVRRNMKSQSVLTNPVNLQIEKTFPMTDLSPNQQS
jgi:hypothetical protein